MARRHRAQVPAGALTFVDFCPEDNGVPVVEQHEAYHRALLEFKRSGRGGHIDLDEFMRLCRTARDVGAAAAVARGEFWTTSSVEWARHLLGPDADSGAVSDLAFRFHEEWKPRA
ncbi:hypothetical protein GCM10011374_03320 [Kocuria dechangensis]|uniref:Uncharacterized protein n=1 Tax=Kocuria dechangensis TaxID=1176249 RepID=A0A917LMQ5_9MICC|nr:hypothetical protein GCM10011374_03320 [Kocuria dechangensis]